MQYELTTKADEALRRSTSQCRDPNGGMFARFALLLVGLTILAGCVGGNIYTGGFRNYCQRTTSESSAYNGCVTREREHADRRRSRSYSP